MPFHRLDSSILPPERFTFPFSYEPHPLCVKAAEEVARHLSSMTLTEGKMFGVLVVNDPDGKLGFLAAYSGLLEGRNDWPWFVPPVFDAQQPEGYFKHEEAVISMLNDEIKSLEQSEEYHNLVEAVEVLKEKARTEISAFRQQMSEAKKRRDDIRSSQSSQRSQSSQNLIRESQFMKATLHRMKLKFADEIAQKEQQLKEFLNTVAQKKTERRQRSDALQRWLFTQYSMLNAYGERRNLIDIFADVVHRLPPAGSGDCCAPKLLQYAYSNNMKPRCMAEFWWGKEPNNELRRHKHFYPACQGKCHPILTHMLRGLNVDDNPLEKYHVAEPEIVYEDEWLIVVNKPHGVLSVPGRGNTISMTDVMKDKYGNVMPIHRLDMATSGLLMFAKGTESLRAFSRLFEQRMIRKRYIAVLSRPLLSAKGRISLPLSADRDERPRQKVDYENGKEAITDYELISDNDGHPIVALYPHTGRTHQLRVHCAHVLGLDSPIMGDELYGKRGKLLSLHSESIEFDHPFTGKHTLINAKMPKIE